jgi:pyrimidine-specific ribonucleoside hydrolase
MRCFVKRLFVLVCLAAPPALAHDIEHYRAVVIDTDMGLDDAVTLAMALQNPRVNIVAIVATEGAASAEKGVEHLESMLELFNRRDVALYAPVGTSASSKAPPFRDFAEHAVGQALPEPAKSFCRPFSPEAYVSERVKTVVLALGPLTNLAAALHAQPEIKDRIAKVIFAGSPDTNTSWNAGYDRDALAAVQAAGVALEFVIPAEPIARKPESWREAALASGQGTSIGESFVRRLLAPPQVRQHYTERLENSSDELAFLYLIDETLFWGRGRKDLLVPSNRADVVALFKRLITDGRQDKQRVVFVDGTLPDNIFQQDVRERKARIIANNGQTEWFAQLLLNELHQHLGAYSIIGVKMGLRAAELLNAPQHAMKVVSHVPPCPPTSCLNDGIIVSTGCTPGRGLFTQAAGRPDAVEVSFEYNDRRVTLALKAEYREKISAGIAALLDNYTLENHEYWQGVRELGLDIWENWHRRDLFEIIQTPAESN